MIGGLLEIGLGLTLFALVCCYGLVIYGYVAEWFLRSRELRTGGRRYTDPPALEQGKTKTPLLLVDSLLDTVDIVDPEERQEHLRELAEFDKQLLRHLHERGPRKPDETIPGGFYIGADGVAHDANGKRLDLYVAPGDRLGYIERTIRPKRYTIRLESPDGRVDYIEDGEA